MYRYRDTFGTPGDGVSGGRSGVYGVGGVDGEQIWSGYDSRAPGLQYGGVPCLQYGGVPGVQYGSVPELQPGGVPGLQYGGVPGLLPGDVHGVQYGAVPGVRVHYGGVPGLQYGDVLGLPYEAVPGVQYESVSGQEYGGVSVLQYSGVPGLQYGVMPGVQYGGVPGLRYGGVQGQQYGGVPGLQCVSVHEVQAGAVPGESRHEQRCEPVPVVISASPREVSVADLVHFCRDNRSAILNGLAAMLTSEPDLNFELNDEVRAVVELLAVADGSEDQGKDWNGVSSDGGGVPTVVDDWRSGTAIESAAASTVGGVPTATNGGRFEGASETADSNLGDRGVPSRRDGGGDPGQDRVAVRSLAVLVLERIMVCEDWGPVGGTPIRPKWGKVPPARDKVVSAARLWCPEGCCYPGRGVRRRGRAARRTGSSRATNCGRGECHGS